MGEMSYPIEAGNVYRDEIGASTTEVEAVFVDEDGETQIRIETRQGRRGDILLVDAESFIERVENDELELIERPDWREG